MIVTEPKNVQVVKLPKNVQSLSHFYSCLDADPYHLRSCYEIIGKDGMKTLIPINCAMDDNDCKMEQIIDDSNDFVNGFKVVQMSNGKYAYLRKSDSTLLPYRFDVAFDFNSYGFAMVGSYNKVTWIDHNFQYFDIQLLKMIECYSYSKSSFRTAPFGSGLAWDRISDFSEGSIPLSRCELYSDTVCYFGIDGNLQRFYKNDGCTVDFSGYGEQKFSDGTEFNKDGYARTSKLILFAKGYYLSNSNFIDFCEKKDLHDVVFNQVDDVFETESQKILNKSLKN